MVYHRSGDRLRTALEDAERRGVDAVVFAGDLTKDGAPSEYDHFEHIVSDLSTPWFAVPGNHDVPKASPEDWDYGDDHESPSVEWFAERYAPTDGLPFVERVGGVDIVGLNSAKMPDDSLLETGDGQVSNDQVTFLEETLPDLSNPVVLMHHNTPAMYDQFRTFRERFRPEMGMPPVMRDPEPVIDVLVDHDVPLALTGHLHNPGVAETGPLREVTVPATGSYPQAYLLVEVGPDGTTISYVPVADIEGMAEAHTLREEGGETSAGYTAFGAIRVARFPLLVDDESNETVSNGESR
jgi:DNA repair exonuclease SbcCD nuclease subunit